MDATANELRWTAVTVVVVVVLSAIDLSLPRANMSAALVVAPFVASGGARPHSVVIVGGLAVTGAVGLAFSDNSGLEASAARMAEIVVATTVAAQTSTLRIRRQQSLLDMATVAEAAQRAIVRQPSAQVGSVAVASCYQSPVRAATVGGDCYDVVLTPFGTRAMVGDVRGHGMPSVRLAALVLGAFRALACVEADLAVVARELDLLTARNGSERRSLNL